MSREPSIRLSKKYGINPAMTICPICGEDANEIALAGDASMYVCLGCGRKEVAPRPPAVCLGCGKRHEWKNTGKFDGSFQRLLASQPCEKCQAAQEVERAEIAARGVLVKCEKCGMKGVLMHTHPMAIELRKKFPDGTTGILIGEENCPVCRGRKIRGAAKLLAALGMNVKLKIKEKQDAFS